MLSSTNTLNGVRIASSLTQGRDLLAEVSRLVSYRYDLPETFDGLLLHLRSALHVDLLTLALADAQSNTVRMRYSRATEVVRANLPVELSLNDSPSGMAWSTQQTVLVSDVANELRWPSLLNPLRSAGVATYCSVPLTAGDRRIGALSLGSLKRHAFGDDELELLRQIAIPVAMAVENELIREYADRYKRDFLQARDRAALLLRSSSAVADQPTIQAVLHGLRGVLANTSTFQAGHLYILDDDQDSLHLCEFDQDADAPAIKVGTKILRIGGVARMLDEQKPVFVPDLSQEMLKHPEMAPFAPEAGGRSTYLFPVSTSQKRYGMLAVTKLHSEEFSPEDIELLRSVASHLAVALESELARDRAELYRRQAENERDRLSLLLEINNHIVSKLEAEELFDAVAASMHKHFGNELTSLWLYDKQTGLAERKFLDFPTGRGFLAKANVTAGSMVERDWFRLRKPKILSGDFAELPQAMCDACRAESIASAVLVPLVGANGPLGLLVMDSRRENAFREADEDLLSQIGTQISLLLDNALAYGRLRQSHDDLQDQRLYLESEISSEFNFEDIVGKSPAIQNAMRQVEIVAATDSTVLLHGETGTGKELFARAIHRGSPRRERTFVRLNCAAIPSGLLESELFGHEKGAFTGALMQKKGRFEIADQRTLFLDEIGDISLELQPKLLRAVQEQEFERLGSTKTIRVNVRIIAATHRDLPTMIRNNQFREDLFYRLNVFPVEIPPLRERTGDIPLLVHYFVTRLARRMRKDIKTIPKRAMEVLANASWRGNVRELENFIERAVILSEGPELKVPIAELKNAMAAPPSDCPSTLKDAERKAVIAALKASSGKISGVDGAAARLGLKRTTLQNKMRTLNISRSDYLQRHRGPEA